MKLNVHINICETKPTVENLNYLHEVNGTVKLKSNHQYYTQIQGQMAITNRLTAWFFVYTQHGNYLEKIEFDPSYWNTVKKKLTAYWYEHFALYLLKKIFVLTKIVTHLQILLARRKMGLKQNLHRS